MREILQKIQVHVPFYLLREKLLPRVIRDGINPEIAFSHHDLDCFQTADFREVADRLADKGLSVTFHAPFMDLRPGALDPRIRKISADRLRQVFDLIPWFRPRSVVCHPSFDERYYISTEAQWLENSLETWRDLLGVIRGMETIIALENVWNNLWVQPPVFQNFVASFKSPWVKAYFDIGNHVKYAAPEEWILTLGSLVAKCHVKDFKLSEADPGAGEFVNIRDGSVRWPAVRAALEKIGYNGWMTIEGGDLSTEENSKRLDLIIAGK